MNMCRMVGINVSTHRYMVMGCERVICIDWRAHTTLNPQKSKIWTHFLSKNQKMSTLTPPKGSFQSFFFNETLYTSYWGIDEWIWILTLVKWPIWKKGHFSTGPPNHGCWFSQERRPEIKFLYHRVEAHSATKEQDTHIHANDKIPW